MRPCHGTLAWTLECLSSTQLRTLLEWLESRARGGYGGLSCRQTHAQLRAAFWTLLFLVILARIPSSETQGGEKVHSSVERRPNTFAEISACLCIHARLFDWPPASSCSSEAGSGQNASTFAVFRLDFASRLPADSRTFWQE